MELKEAVKEMLICQGRLRQPDILRNPSELSEQMAKLAAYTATVEEHLAKFEEWLELEEARLYKGYMVDRDEKMTATAAEKLVKLYKAKERAQIKYLTRIVSSSWRLVSTAQSRWNHLQSEKTGQI